MKILVSGHRLHKLNGYSLEWIKEAITEAIVRFPGMSLGLSGMAGGIDLFFCQCCLELDIPYIACPPFEEQIDTLPEQEKPLRKYCMDNAKEIWKIRNSAMVTKADGGIIVWDGNKGGTHNVFQQMIEKKKPLIWINPVSEKIWECF